MRDAINRDLFQSSRLFGSGLRRRYRYLSDLS